MRLTELIFGWQGAVIAEFILTWLVIYLIFMRPRRKAQRADSRYYNRYESRFKGWLVSNGQKRKIRGIDLNNSGALIASRLPLAPGDRVFVYIESARLMGSADVRHCVPGRIFGYNVGVEFRGPLMRATEGIWQFHQYHAADLQSN
jgi:hypothetical protein